MGKTGTPFVQRPEEGTEEETKRRNEGKRDKNAPAQADKRLVFNIWNMHVQFSAC